MAAFQETLVPLDPATLWPLPSTPALSGVLETLAFFRDPDFARSRFERYGDVYETSLLGQRTVFNRGGQAIGDLFAQGDAVQGWWPGSVRELLGPLSRAKRNGADHKALDPRNRGQQLTFLCTRLMERAFHP